MWYNSSVGSRFLALWMERVTLQATFTGAAPDVVKVNYHVLEASTIVVIYRSRLFEVNLRVLDGTLDAMTSHLLQGDPFR